MAEPIQRFALQFYSNLGRVVRINIPRANPDKTGAEIQAAMEALSDDGTIILNASTGIPTAPKRAQLVTTTRRRIL